MNCKLLTLATILTAASAFGQETLRVNIPFEFWAANQSWAPGNYEVSFRHQGIAKISNVDLKKSAMIIAASYRSAKPNAQPALVFNRYGNDLFLRQMIGPRENGYELRPSARERETAARLRTGPEVVAQRSR